MASESLQKYHTLRSYHETVTRLRSFFLERGFLEVDTQSRRSILAACEDPRTIASFFFAKTEWPLPQTGQMWLEHELLKNPDLPGIFCLTTSYRDEPNPIPGRHMSIFPLFEFETHGGMDVLQNLAADMLTSLDLGSRDSFEEGDYQTVASKYRVHEIEAPEETKIWEDFGPVFFLKNFPFHTSPFFNMKKNGNVANKIDAILFGQETIGAAERSCNPDEMRELFHTISDGGYAGILYKKFGRERVDKELDEYLSFDFFPRCGGGIGVNRLMRAMALAKEASPHTFVGAQVMPTMHEQTH